MPERMMKILVLLSLLLIVSIALVTFGITYAGGVRGFVLMGVFSFFAGGVIVILVQLMPAEILLASFIGTTFAFLRKSGASLQAG
jgi:hypothetical protein